MEYGLLGAVLTAGSFVCSKGNHKKGLSKVIHNVAEREKKQSSLCLSLYFVLIHSQTKPFLNLDKKNEECFPYSKILSTC